MTETRTESDATPLDEDQRQLLVEQLTAALHTIDDRMAEHRMVLQDAGPQRRASAHAVLDALEQRARAHVRRLRHLRAGGPSCRDCARPLPFDLLQRDALAERCQPCATDHRPTTGST